MRSSRLLMILVVALASALTAPTAQAVCPTPLPTHTVTLGPTNTNWSNPLITIPKYDGSSGTLCMVVVRLSANLEAQVHATNNSTNPATLTATMNVSANITAPSPITNFTATPISSMQSLNLPGGGSTTFLAGPIPSSQTQNFSTPAELAAFMAPGNLLFSAAGNGSFTFTSSSGNATATGITTAGAQIEVTYWVPEPGSLALLAFGAFAILHRRRR